MKVARLAIEIAFVFASALGVLWLLAPLTYLLAGSILAAVLVALVIATTGVARRVVDYDPLIEDHATPMWALLLYWALCVVLVVALWPGLPIVLAIRRASDARGDGADPEAPGSAHPSDPAGPSPER